VKLSERALALVAELNAELVSPQKKPQLSPGAEPPPPG